VGPWALLTPPRGPPHRGGVSLHAQGEPCAMCHARGSGLTRGLEVLLVCEAPPWPWPTRSRPAPAHWRRSRPGRVCPWPPGVGSVDPAEPAPANGGLASLGGGVRGAVVTGGCPGRERGTPTRLRRAHGGHGGCQSASSPPVGAAAQRPMLRALLPGTASVRWAARSGSRRPLPPPW